jgi:hypothetical protein
MIMLESLFYLSLFCHLSKFMVIFASHSLSVLYQGFLLHPIEIFEQPFHLWGELLLHHLSNPTCLPKSDLPYPYPFPRECKMEQRFPGQGICIA